MKQNASKTGANINNKQKEDNRHKEIKLLKEEIKDLQLDVLIVMQTALYFAGIKKEFIPACIDLYIQKLDENPELEYNEDNVIKIIESIKAENKQFL